MYCSLSLRPWSVAIGVIYLLTGDRVVLYVDEDPPALSWSKDRPMDILVSSRISDLTEAGKILENQRTGVIMNVNGLMPHIHRCRKIAF